MFPEATTSCVGCGCLVSTTLDDDYRPHRAWCEECAEEDDEEFIHPNGCDCVDCVSHHLNLDKDN